MKNTPKNCCNEAKTTEIEFVVKMTKLGGASRWMDIWRIHDDF